MSVRYYPPVPRSVGIAETLVYLRALLWLVAVVLAFTQKGDLRRQVAHRYPGYNDRQIDATVNVGVYLILILGVIFATTYVLVAAQMHQGKNPARIAIWVFAGLDLLLAISRVAGTISTANAIVDTTAIVMLIAIIVLLIVKPAGSFFHPKNLRDLLEEGPETSSA